MSDYWLRKRAQSVIGGLTRRLHIDASRLAGSSAGISQFALTDISGSGLHAIQPAGSKQAKVYTNGQNGKNVIRFDGVDDYYYVPNSTGGFKEFHSAQATILFCGKAGTTSNPNAAYYVTGNAGGSSATGFLLGADNSSSFGTHRASVNCYNGSGNLSVGTSNASFNNSFLNNTTSIVAVSIDAANATAANRISITTNGTTYTGNTQTQAVNTGAASNNLGIGCYIHSNAPGGYFLGDFHELVMIPSLLSGAILAAAIAELNTKWAEY